MCHAGSLHSRRGGTYVGGDYSIPVGMEADTHYKKNIQCIDCHLTGPKGMGDIQRKATCQDCHLEIEDAHSRSIHKDVQCSACHINELRGYQIVIWGPGKVAGKQNPFKKYSLYHGIQSPPLIIKDQKGKWIAVKVFPHALGNFKLDVKPSEGLQFRWKDGDIQDSYYIVGTESIGVNDKHLLWIEIQHASHPFGKGRTCESCHKEESQTSFSQWEFEDDQGTEKPFRGKYKIIAGRDGLKIKDMRNITPIFLSEDYKIEDFASWLYLKDKWKMPGDFSIKTDKIKYDKYQTLSKNIIRELKTLDRVITHKDKKTKRHYKTLRAIAMHNEDQAMELIKEFKSNLK
ncbi:MAG: cytochrome c3 family protein [Thermodesulfovibrionales bacterium]|nr:cytochrome c3 family protein [Thermodesulfovibrionales bacterium]